MPKLTSWFLLKWNKLLLLEEIVTQIDELKKSQNEQAQYMYNKYNEYEIMNIVNNQLHLVAFELVLCTLQRCSV